MRRVNRRSFLRSAAALPVLGVAGDGHAAAPPGVEPPQPPLDPALLRALAHVVLPSELGDDGVERAVQNFERWLAAFEPVAEAEHGYGTGDVDYLPPDPAPGWAAQLRALDLESQRRWSVAFTALDPGRREELLRRHLSGERGPALPAPLAARHVALGLLAWWAASPEATDVAYRARIGRLQCRPLATAPEQPAPLSGE